MEILTGWFPCDHGYYHDCPDCDSSSPVAVFEHTEKITELENNSNEFLLAEAREWSELFSIVAEVFSIVAEIRAISC